MLPPARTHFSVSRSEEDPQVPFVRPDSSSAAMPYGDFDTESLAVYLHLTPQQVSRLADRGRLPGRKVSGRWRFARAEIHHWLEGRIGLSDEEDLVDVDDALQRSAGSEQPREIRIGELLPREAIGITCNRDRPRCTPRCSPTALPVPACASGNRAGRLARPRHRDSVSQCPSPPGECQTASWSVCPRNR